eukprot:g2816.t1
MSPAPPDAQAHEATRQSRLHTPLCDVLGIRHPIMLAGMNSVSTAELAAAVSNAGGFGSIGGQSFAPAALRTELQELTSLLHEDKKRNFGVDLLLPQVEGENARKTNYDYTEGKLPELIEIICEFRPKLFICAVGVPPVWAVEKLHQHGVLVMNMVGSVRNCEKALKVGADLICAQGYEAGGHTGDVATSVLVPLCCDVVRKSGRRMCAGCCVADGRSTTKAQHLPPPPVLVVGAGGIFDGRGLAAVLSLGATAGWVGTRFVCTTESHAPKHHKEKILRSGSSDTVRTLLLTGRPLRLIPNGYIKEGEKDPGRVQKLLEEGKIPVYEDVGRDWDLRIPAREAATSLAGQACGGVKEILSAKEVVDRMVREACAILLQNRKMVVVGGGAGDGGVDPGVGAASGGGTGFARGATAEVSTVGATDAKKGRARL